MKNLITGSRAVAVVIVLSGLSGSAVVLRAGGQQGPQDRYPTRGGQQSGSQDPRQHGYEHAYRDGADRGRQDREAGRRYNFKDNDYQSGALEYQGSFGDKAQYMSGYREGFKAGYDDGYYDRPGQYQQLYARPSDGRWDSTRGGANTPRSGGSIDDAFDTGYSSGVTAGQQDQRRNVRSNYRGTPAYQNADAGYRPGAGDRNAYTLQFRDGFERGYADGYGRTQHSSDGGGYFPTPDPTGHIDTRDGQKTTTRTITVPGNQLWTTTNIRVNQGDPFQLQVTGEVRFSANANDRAASYGSVTPKYLPGSPLPQALAGALIGRIDNGLPFGIGNQTTLSMPASGILYLGINDDNVSNNAGEFKVVLTW
jgi:hypothetical protein